MTAGLATSSNTVVDLSSWGEALETVPAISIRGGVTGVIGPVITATLTGISVGDIVEISGRTVSRQESKFKKGLDRSVLAQVIGYRDSQVMLTPFGGMPEIVPGAEVRWIGSSPKLSIGPHLLGAVVDSLGEVRERLCAPVVQGNAISLRPTSVALHNAPPCPIHRQPIKEPFVTGIRAIDGFVTMGKGQRLAVFAEPGVGKSTLMGMISRTATSPINVIGLIGERGREVRDFLHESLSTETRPRSIVVVSTSDEPAVRRVAAALTATRIAEYFRDAGLDVLLQIDSLTRLMRAYREIGLAAGEVPVRRGYPSSVYAKLPTLIERAGAGQHGTITALYTVLLSSDLDEDPMVEEIKGLTDGHIQLSRKIAESGVYPAIDVLRSISRLQPRLLSTSQLETAKRVRALLARFDEDRDLFMLGNTKGDLELEQAALLDSRLRGFLTQSIEERTPFAETFEQLRVLGIPESELRC